MGAVAAVMLVKDERDVIEHTVRHLLHQVDRVYIADNDSSDGTRAVLEALIERGAPLDLFDDPVVGYWQSAKTSQLAEYALSDGFQWVVPCDADEVWYCTDGRRIADYLTGLGRDVIYVRAPMHHHLGSSEDDQADECPFTRIKWRQRQEDPLGKVACRLTQGLVIGMGNHDAWAPGAGLTIKGRLTIRHFPWRSEAQYIRKIRTGEQAYAATTLDPQYGMHWRQWAGKPDEAISDWFWRWGYSQRPREDETLILDPAPLTRWLSDRERDQLAAEAEAAAVSWQPTRGADG